MKGLDWLAVSCISLLGGMLGYILLYSTSGALRWFIVIVVSTIAIILVCAVLYVALQPDNGEEK